MSRLRAFIAIEASTEVRAAVGALVNELKGRVTTARWIPAQNLHITVRFLGWTSEETLSELTEELRDVLAKCKPFLLEFRGIGLFPTARRARVISALVSQPPPELDLLHRQVEAAVYRHGFPAERRPFRPHLTFARLRSSTAALPRIQAELDQRSLGRAAVDVAIVFESALKQTGAVYHPRARLALGG